ncbi:MAG: cysteine--tRNA ligase [Sandaracinaceae bacterium]|jgi:cysteinyl-tRNA synthetase|nr:cysteine--tRNA ligase [Sandaracinaceae bacterium]
MAFALYDSLTAQKRLFTTQTPGHAKLYVCGMTVYDYAHVGHARCYTIYDVLVRHLRESGMKVTYVRNITDVEDKIVARAKKNGETSLALSQRFTAMFHEDMERLHNLPADIEPRVSEHIPDIQALVQRLIDKGAAYESAGDVYFRVKAFPGYGKLSHRKLDNLEYGASGRTTDDEESRKEHPADFALWKKSDEPNDSWPSAFGRGRPGWHIECSAMAMKHLGETFDLHAGGLDLVFPHHENEIAQSEAATGKPYANHWMHNGFIETNKEKMSKSLGNFFTAREVFNYVEPEAVRYFVMSVHYRSPLNFDWTLDAENKVSGFPQLEDAERRVEYIYTTRERLLAIPSERVVDTIGKTPEAIQKLKTSLQSALDDDLNMPIALGAVSDFLREVNELVDGASRKKGNVAGSVLVAAKDGFATIGRLLGLGTEDPSALLLRIRARRIKARGFTEEAVEAKIQERIAARNSKDFALADAVRAELSAMGVELMDSPTGTTWRIP